MRTIFVTDGQHEPIAFFTAFTLIDAIVVKYGLDDMYHWTIKTTGEKI